MQKHYTVLEHVSSSRRIRKSTDPVFLLELQRGLLLELKNRGFLNNSQYIVAEENLSGQFRQEPEEKR